MLIGFLKQCFSVQLEFVYLAKDNGNADTVLLAKTALQADCIAGFDLRNEKGDEALGRIIPKDSHAKGDRWS